MSLFEEIMGGDGVLLFNTITCQNLTTDEWMDSYASGKDINSIAHTLKWEKTNKIHSVCWKKYVLDHTYDEKSEKIETRYSKIIM